MTRVADAMTTGVRAMAPHDTLLRAARQMRAFGVDALPVCIDGKLIGMVTARDIVTRGVAQGCAAQTTHVSDVMGDQVCWCFDDQQIDEVLAEIRGSHVWSLPVVDRDRHLVGMLSIGDTALKTGDTALKTGDPVNAGTLWNVHEPAQPERSSQLASSPVGAEGPLQ